MYVVQLLHKLDISNRLAAKSSTYGPLNFLRLVLLAIKLSGHKSPSGISQHRSLLRQSVRNRVIPPRHMPKPNLPIPLSLQLSNRPIQPQIQIQIRRPSAPVRPVIICLHTSVLRHSQTLTTMPNSALTLQTGIHSVIPLTTYSESVATTRDLFFAPCPCS